MNVTDRRLAHLPRPCRAGATTGVTTVFALVVGMVVLVGCGDDSQMDAYQQRRAAQIAAAQRGESEANAGDAGATDAGASDAGAADTDTGGDVASGAGGTPTVEPTGVVVPVLALDNTFRPEITEIEVGDEVLWENRGQNNHDILYVEGDDFGIELADFGPGVVYSHIFTEPGEYRYYCTVHGNDRVGMIGTIIVN